jgi:hypothetical protein
MAKKVFFSFHYKDVEDFRANVVRNSHVVRAEGESAGFFDASLWEEAERKGSTAIKKMIDDGLSGTTVTAVLIGSETATRPWVIYEIFESIKNGSKVLGVHINQIKCNLQRTKQHGANPFENLAFYYDNNGTTAHPCEFDPRQGKWVYSSDAEHWTLKAAQPNQNGRIVQLTHWHPTYCWISHDGYNNFGPYE